MSFGIYNRSYTNVCRNHTACIKSKNVNMTQIKAMIKVPNLLINYTLMCNTYFQFALLIQGALILGQY